MAGLGGIPDTRHSQTPVEVACVKWTEAPAFRRLSYKIAFSEYSMALGYEMAKQDPAIPADDLLYEVRSTPNRIAGASAALYR